MRAGGRRAAAATAAAGAGARRRAARGSGARRRRPAQARSGDRAAKGGRRRARGGRVLHLADEHGIPKRPESAHSSQTPGASPLAVGRARRRESPREPRRVAHGLEVRRGAGPAPRGSGPTPTRTESGRSAVKPAPLDEGPEAVLVHAPPPRTRPPPPRARAAVASTSCTRSPRPRYSGSVAAWWTSTPRAGAPPAPTRARSQRAPRHARRRAPRRGRRG